jgi:hypothetical protein
VRYLDSSLNPSVDRAGIRSHRDFTPERHRDCVDYVEVAIEQIRITAPTPAIAEQMPVLLQCSSMSVAGFVPPTVTTLDAISGRVHRRMGHDLGINRSTQMLRFVKTTRRSSGGS